MTDVKLCADDGQGGGGTARNLALAASVAYEKSRVAKATAGTLYGFFGYTSNTGGIWIQAHDAASLPANNAVPKIILWVPAAGNFSADFGVYGLAFAAGIVICTSSTGPTLTLGGSNDTWFDVQYK